MYKRPGADERSPLQQLVSTDLVDALRSAPWPTHHAVRHGALGTLPAWLREPWLGDIATLRRLCPGEALVMHPDVVHLTSVPSGPGRDAAELLLRYGHTVCFPGASHAIPGARPFLDALADEVGIMRRGAELNLIVAPPGRGLCCHLDSFDALIVQLRGDVHWRVGRRPAVSHARGGSFTPGTRPTLLQAAEMASGVPQTDETELDDVVLRPGSVLFVPRGTFHSSAAGSAESVSAVLVLAVPSLGELMLYQLSQVIAQDPRLRQPAIGFAGNAAQRQRAAQAFGDALGALAENVPALSAQAVVEMEASTEHLASRIARSSRFIRDPSLSLDIANARDTDDGELIQVDVVRGARARPTELATPDVLETPPEGLELLRWVETRHGIFTAADLAAAFAEFSFGSIAGILAELVATQLVISLPFGAPRPG